MNCTSIYVVLLIAVISVTQTCASVIFEKRSVDEWNAVLKLASKFTPTGISTKQREDVSGLPYTSYFVKPAAIASNQLLSSAEPSRLNYLIFEKKDLIGSVQVNPNLRQIEGFQANTAITADFWKVLQLAKALKATENHDYYVRYLGCSSLLFAALWLHADSDDIIIPIGNSFERWSAFKPYSVTEISSILSRETKKLRKINTSEQGAAANP